MSLKVKQVKSSSGSTVKQIANLKGIGLGRIGKEKVLQDTPEIRGMIAKVAHLIEVEQIDAEA